MADVRRRRVEDSADAMRRSLRSWLWRVPVAQEVDEELSFHVEMHCRELMRQGMPPEQARQIARRRAAELMDVRRTCVSIATRRDREMRLTQWLDELWSDVR